MTVYLLLSLYEQHNKIKLLDKIIHCRSKTQIIHNAQTAS